jgi:hypothetical protein
MRRSLTRRSKGSISGTGAPAMPLDYGFDASMRISTINVLVEIRISGRRASRGA